VAAPTGRIRLERLGHQEGYCIQTHQHQSTGQEQVLTNPTEQKYGTKDAKGMAWNDGRTVATVSCTRLPDEAATFHAGHNSAVIPNNDVIDRLGNGLGCGN